MQVTLRSLLESSDALSRLIAQPAPGKLAYRLAKVAKAVKAELETYESARRPLCARLGKLNEDRSAYEFEGENKEAFKREHDELLAVEANLDVGHLSVDDIGNLQISGADLLALEWLITE
jgi:hypothetical protein